MMTDPVDTLRRAAEKVRGAAEAATPGPWQVKGEAIVPTGSHRISDAAARGFADEIDENPGDCGSWWCANVDRALAVARLLLGNQQ